MHLGSKLAWAHFVVVLFCIVSDLHVVAEWMVWPVIAIVWLEEKAFGKLNDFPAWLKVGQIVTLGVLNSYLWGYTAAAMWSFIERMRGADEDDWEVITPASATLPRPESDTSESCPPPPA
jgi:hypothetical protein